MKVAIPYCRGFPVKDYTLVMLAVIRSDDKRAPLRKNTLMSWTIHRSACRPKRHRQLILGLTLCALAILSLHALGWADLS
jgi:hypothetical protein